MVYAYLMGEAKGEAVNQNRIRAIAFYAEAEYDVLKMLCLIHAGKHGVENRSTSDKHLRVPEYGVVLVELLPLCMR